MSEQEEESAEIRIEKQGERSCTSPLEDFAFYSERDGQPSEGFDSGSDMTDLKFVKVLLQRVLVSCTCSPNLLTSHIPFLLSSSDIFPFS